MDKDIKQVIVIRKDLNMRKGKMAAQASHASIGAFLKNASLGYNVLSKNLTRIEQEWFNDKSKKIVVGVESEEEFDKVIEDLSKTEISYYVVTDAGLTEFDGPTRTAIGIGPYYSDEIDKITGNLNLL